MIPQHCLVFLHIVVSYTVKGVNIALGKPTTQSSVTLNGVSSRAVDGNTNGDFSGGSCIHTLHGLREQWWLLDLQGIYNISRVRVKNRSDMHGFKFHDFVVDVFSKHPLNCDDVRKVQCYSHPGPAGLGETVDMPCVEETVGRYVRLMKLPEFISDPTQDILIVCEVKVTGSLVPAQYAEVRGQHFSRQQGKRTLTSTAVIPQQTNLACISFCNTDNSCHGINYHYGNRDCQLTQFDTERAFADLPSDSNGWDHYSLC